MSLVAYLTFISKTLWRRSRCCQAVFQAGHIGTSNRFRRHHATHRRERARKSDRNEGASLPVFRRKSGRDEPSFLPTSKPPPRRGHAEVGILHGVNGTGGYNISTRHLPESKPFAPLPYNLHPKLPCLPCGQVRAFPPVYHFPALNQALPKCPRRATWRQHF